ncbi:MAG TPA: glutamate-5-semialdehyde dehydrogenase [Peptococcaceae bacterium]|nr:MAG: Gamma-glutamyl phosphate reductase [Clostridia bacterium 41_269]HBT20425.1 glutamate-5-semialdehyde dehydrogenase [Peptococcaceae bacterium]
MVQQELEVMGIKAKEASRILASAPSNQKDAALESMAKALREGANMILEANSKDMEAGREKGLSKAMLDRLLLTPERIEEMAKGLEALIALPDPVGKIDSMWTRPNGLQIGKMRVPLGVIGIIYESRPNVTVDASGLCIKTGNAVILRGGSEAFNSNVAIAGVISSALGKVGLPEEAIQLVKTTDREAVNIMLKMNKYLDVLIPRGGAGLIRLVVENASVPVLETGVGNCHVYVDDAADLEMAVRIAVNSKVQRPAVCNAAETLLVHSGIAEKFLPLVAEELQAHGVELRGCERTRKILPNIKAATEDDYYMEFLDLIMAVKIVDSLEEAIDHIHTYGSGHTEAIVTDNYHHARAFVQKVDAAAVNVNASTRFTDGYQYGLGAEIGISTQKLHARGPMGLEELTTSKFVVYGNGQIRE